MENRESGLVRFLKSVKHEIFVMRKRGSVKRFGEPVRQAVQKIRSKPVPEWWLTDTFLADDAAHQCVQAGAVPRHIFLFWTGENRMSDRRADCLSRFESTNSGLDIRYLSADACLSIEVPGHPLHRAYRYLSPTHRSDYLRAYCLYHHGGGYSDIKVPRHVWSPVFEALESSPCSIAGYPEIDRFNVPFPAPFGEDLWDFSGSLVGQAAMIAKPGSRVFADLVHHMELLLDEVCDELEASASGSAEYPLRWSQLLGEIWYPLQLKYRDEILRDRRLSLVLKNYR